uniref:Uncharacterized protein n=1 Tax=Solanum lycopersicum TaxID=4081 RepID=A0A3Q7GA55_SOLLC
MTPHKAHRRRSQHQSEVNHRSDRSFCSLNHRWKYRRRTCLAGLPPHIRPSPVHKYLSVIRSCELGFQRMPHTNPIQLMEFCNRTEFFL